MTSSKVTDIVISDNINTQLRNLPAEINTLHLDFNVKDEHMKYLNCIRINRLIIRLYDCKVTDHGLKYIAGGNIRSIEMKVWYIDTNHKYLFLQM